MPLLSGDYQVVPFVIGEDHQAAPINATELSCSFSVWNEVDDQGLVSLDYTWLDSADITAPSIPSAVR